MCVCVCVCGVCVCVQSAGVNQSRLWCVRLSAIVVFVCFCVFAFVLVRVWRMESGSDKRYFNGCVFVFCEKMSVLCLVP